MAGLFSPEALAADIKQPIALPPVYMLFLGLRVLGTARATP